MSYAIKHLFHINAPRQKVFEAISTIEGLSNWWTTDTKGEPAVGGTIVFRFSSFGGPDMKVIESKAGEKLSWECLDSPHGWVGNKLHFILDENDGKTRVRFSHEGYAEQDDHYASTNFSWARYMESLRQYCQTGKGEAFGSEGYRK